MAKAGRSVALATQRSRIRGLPYNYKLTFRVNLKEVSEKNGIAVDLKVTGILRFAQNDNFELLGGQRTPKSQNIIAFLPKIWVFAKIM
jgi:hypothetical protein